MSAQGRVWRRCRKDCPPDCRKHKWSFHVELPRTEHRHTDKCTPDCKRRSDRDQATKSGFPTKKDAQDTLAEVREQVRKGTLAPDRRITVERYFNDWLGRKIESNKIRPSTVAGYRQHVRDYIAPEVGGVRLSKLRAHHVEKVLRRVREEGARDKNLPKVRKGKTKARGAGPATTQRVFATLRSALRSAERRGELAHDPTRHVELESVGRPEIHPWTPEECSRFLSAIEDDRLYPLFALAIVSGLRRGELCGLRWADLDLDAGEVTVRQQATQRGAEIRFADPKSARSKRRVVVLDDGTINALKRHQIAQDLDRLQWGDDYQDHNLVFAHEDGSPLRPDHLTKLLPRLADKAGVRRCRFHDLRHASATFGIAAGEELLEVSRRLGHSSIALTGDTYSDTVPQRVREAAKKRASLVLGEAS